MNKLHRVRFDKPARSFLGGTSYPVSVLDVCDECLYHIQSDPSNYGYKVLGNLMKSKGKSCEFCETRLKELKEAVHV